MPIIIEESQRPQATQVLEILKRMLDKAEATGYAYISPYENGREHGYHVTFWKKGTKDHLAVSFSEYRKSDNIVVYTGNEDDFAYNTGIPNEEVYKKAHFLKCEDYTGAAKYAFDFLLDINQK